MSEKPPNKPKDIRRKEFEPMRLNKYLAKCGVASRRKCGDFVKEGLVTVNGKKEDNPAYIVQESDEVTFKGKPVQLEVRLVYLLMNKPKGVITTNQDERGRKTVMDLIKEPIDQRIFPVGRLDKDTTGLLLLTNDGDLAVKLTHPSYNVRKIYHVQLNKPVTDDHIKAIAAGLELEDGKAVVDAVSHVRGASNNEVGIELHIGWNRIVRRIFEHLGYEVIKLDRVYYAGLTKKNLRRGWYRRLTEKEIIMLRHFT